MKLLPRKVDIDKAKAQERKQEIDSGMALAKSVDKIRETKLNEERALREWRNDNIAKIQQEIDSYIEVKENLRIATEKAELHRKALLEPLDKEWEEINLEKAKAKKIIDDAYTLMDQAKEEEKVLEQQRDRLSQIIAQSKLNEKDTEKAKQEAISLKQLAHTEYEIAREEHTTQSDNYERRLSEVAQREKEYEVALSLIKIREKEVEEKEVELLKERKHLESQQAALRIARDVLRK